jgi:hypothetical protein
MRADIKGNDADTASANRIARQLPLDTYVSRVASILFRDINYLACPPLSPRYTRYRQLQGGSAIIATASVHHRYRFQVAYRIPRHD